MKKVAAHLLASILFFGFAFLVSYLVYGWSGYPRGWDANVHIYQVKLIQDFWPNIWWTHTWAGGMALFTWYPVVFPYIILAFLANIFKVTPEFILNAATVFSAGVVGIGIYLTILRLTSNFLLSIFLSLTFLATPAVWGWTFESGLYERFYAFAPFSLAVWAFISFWFEEEKWKRKIFLFLTIVFTGLTFAVQGLMAFNLVALFVFLSFVLSLDIKKTISIFFKVPFVGFLLAAFAMLSVFILPFPGFPISPAVEIIRERNVAFLQDIFLLIKPSNQFVDHYGFQTPYLWTLQPVLVGVLILGFLLFVLRFFKRGKRLNVQLRLILSLFVLVVALFIYSIEIFPILFLKILYGGIWLPKWVLPFLAYFSVILAGILLDFAFRGRNLFRSLFSLLGITTLLLWLFIQFPLSSPFPRGPYQIRTEEGYPSFSIISKLNLKNEPNFRFGTGDYAGVASWFNLLYPYLPQTRDHCAYCITDADSYFYLQQALWRWEDNIPESLFLLDWWGIDKFIVKLEHADEKFRTEGLPFKFLAEDGEYASFEYQNPKPIIEAARAPAVLLIGKGKLQYDLFFRSLAKANLNSSLFIPIEGSIGLEGYSLEKLKNFDAIVIYEPKFKDAGKVAEVLEEYLKDGGRVWIEGDSTFIDEFSGFSPVEVVSPAKVSKRWNFETGQSEASKEILKGINLANFAPPELEGGPWGIWFAGKLARDASPVVLENGRLVVVTRQVGKGRVVWSGLNLFYHTDFYKSEEEARLLGNILSWLTEKAKERVAYTGFKAEFVNPQERRVVFEGEGQEGVLFREFYTGNWKAYIERGGQAKKIKISKAGPGFMHVFLPNVKSGDTLVFRYSRGFIENLGTLISLGTAIGLILYLFDWWIFKPYIFQFQQRLVKPFKSLARWWEREEE